MTNKKTKVPFKGTPEQKAGLLEALHGLKGQRGAMMPALQKAQNIYGYLPIEVQKIVADELDLRLEEIYGVVTFYSQFSLNPKGRYKISVCLGTACYVKGAGDILDKIAELTGVAAGGCGEDGKYSLEACRCIGACGLAPVITVNEDVYGRLKLDEIPEIVAKYDAME